MKLHTRDLCVNFTKGRPGY